MPVLRPLKGLQRGGRGALARLDAGANALYTWRYNPLYHSGALVVASFVVLIATGLYLLLFYRIGSPYASVVRLHEQVLLGRWIRTMHRYVSDLAVIASVIHAFRMFVQGRTWGPRALAWISGLVLLGVFYVTGWTGYVMVWDGQAQLLAAEGARIMDGLPLFSEPISRTFVGERSMPGAFFFLNLFAHIAVPVGIALVLWIHVSRLARSYLMPPRALLWGMIALFFVASVAWPAPMSPEADLLRVPGQVPLDLMYGFWLPFTRGVGVGWVWLVVVGALTAAVSVPWLTRPPQDKAPPPSWVNPKFCTGCEQCYHDCPYEAISMVPRKDDRDGFVGLVDPAKCVSCGICSGSCAPMGVGPEGRTGRDQLAEVKAFTSERPLSDEEVVVVGCLHGATLGRTDFHGSRVLTVGCVGSLHTSVIEYLVRGGVGGVLVASCPPRDCWNREGVTWLDERVYNEREAELKERVDRRRVRIVHAGEAETGVLEAHLETFRSQMRALGRALAEDAIEIDVLCEAPVVSVAEEARR